MSEPRTIVVTPEKPGGAQAIGVAVATVPSRLHGGVAIRVDAKGMDYSVNLDISELSIAPDGNPATQFVPVWHEGADGVEVWRVPVDAIPADAPADGQVYGRWNNTWVDVTEFVTIDWEDISNKPAFFPPSAHTHPISDVQGLEPRLAADEAAIAGKVSKTGDTMTGHLGLPSGPAAANAVRKDYVDAGLATKVGEAPTDGKQYARKNAAWAEFASPIPTDAPSDGSTYGRKDAAWSKIVGGATISDTPPASPLPGQLWWESDTGGMFVSYNDGNSQQWVQTNASSSMRDAPIDGLAYVRGGGVWMSGGYMAGPLNVCAGLPAPAGPYSVNARAVSIETLGLNAHLDAAGTGWTATRAGFSGLMSLSVADGLFSWYSAPSVAAGAAAMPAPVASLDRNGSFSAGGYAFKNAPNASIYGSADNLTYQTNANCYMNYNRVSGLWNWVVNSVQVASTDVAGNTRARLSVGVGNTVIQDTAVTIRGNGGNSHIFWQDTAGNNSWIQYSDPATGLMHFASPTSTIQFTNGGGVRADGGYQCKQGMSGGYGGNIFSLWYNNAGATHLYVDNTDFGTINTTSDYRTKKDVAELSSTWETVKALRPISYTQADFTPPSAREASEESGEPFIKGDEIERWGFIAHELQETLTESAATGVKDDPGAIQSPNPWTIIAALTKTVQELQARVEALEAGNV